MTATRIYAVVTNDHTSKTHLIEATSQSSAKRHVAEKMIRSIEIARGKDVAAHYKAGAQVEVAGEDTTATLPGIDEK